MKWKKNYDRHDNMVKNKRIQQSDKLQGGHQDRCLASELGWFMVIIDMVTCFAFVHHVGEENFDVGGAVVILVALAGCFSLTAWLWKGGR